MQRRKKQASTSVHGKSCPVNRSKWVEGTAGSPFVFWGRDAILRYDSTYARQVCLGEAVGWAHVVFHHQTLIAGCAMRWEPCCIRVHYWRFMARMGRQPRIRGRIRHEELSPVSIFVESTMACRHDSNYIGSQTPLQTLRILPSSFVSST